MNTRLFPYQLLFFFTLLFSSCALSQTDSQDQQQLKSTSLQTQTHHDTLSGFEISLPYQSENLQIFFLLGQDQTSARRYIGLAEAMESKKVKIKETGEVNQLSISNSSDEYVYINSGDIVKGGKQDRTLAFDLIVPPNTKDLPLESFCVEQGRWRKRGDESIASFSSNTQMLLQKGGENGPSDPQYWLRLNDQHGNITFSTGNGDFDASFISADADISDGNWYHLFAMREGEEMSLWLDGEELVLENKPLKNCSNDQSLKIGFQDFNGKRNLFEGELKDLRIFKEALTAEEIKCLASLN